MIRITWQDVTFEIRRVAVSSSTRTRLGESLTHWAVQLGVDVVDPSSEAREGDFWIACVPDRGWGATDPQRTAWASLLEIDEAWRVLGIRPLAANGLWATVRRAFNPTKPQAAWAA